MVGFTSTPKKEQIIDPGHVGYNSQVEDWLRYFQRALDQKFSQTSDAFRQFDIKQTGYVNFHEFVFIIDQLSIRFNKAALIEMFQYLDSDKDNRLTYEDFVNLKYTFMGGPQLEKMSNFDDKKSSQTIYSRSTITVDQDPFLNMQRDVNQRREYDLAQMDDDIQGSTQQKRYKALQRSGGTFSPREFGGSTSFHSKNSFMSQQTHGLPSGFSTEDKKNVRQKLVGGNMYGVLHNQYYQDSVEEQEKRE